MTEVKSLYDIGFEHGYAKAKEESDPQAYEHGVKDTLDEYAETCRIASEIKMAMGCKTAKECRDLIWSGEIQRVKHGMWVKITNYGTPEYMCNTCGRKIRDDISLALINKVYPYCHCGAKMDLDEVKE